MRLSKKRQEEIEAKIHEILFSRENLERFGIDIFAPLEIASEDQREAFGALSEICHELQEQIIETIKK